MISQKRPIKSPFRSCGISWSIKFDQPYVCIYMGVFMYFVYVCVYIYMYIYMYIYKVHTHMYVCIYICNMYVCMYVCNMYVCMYVCIYVCMYVCINISPCEQQRCGKSPFYRGKSSISVGFHIWDWAHHLLCLWPSAPGVEGNRSWEIFLCQWMPVWYRERKRERVWERER